MGRKRKTPRYILLFADDLHSIGEDGTYDDEGEDEPKNNLGEKLQCPIADEVLIALRKAFSLSFPRNYLIENFKDALAEIRRIGVDALKPMPDILADLSLQPVPQFMNDPIQNKVQLFRFVFARHSDIDISIKVNGKRHRLLDYLGNEDGTVLIETLRNVVSDTFAEAFDEDQHFDILRRIRERIHSVLPGFNECLKSIEVEPIAAYEMHAEDDSEESNPDTARPSD